MKLAKNIILEDPGRLKPYAKRNFVPHGVDLKQSANVENLFKQLLTRRITSAQELEQWLWDRSEFDAALSEERSILYIRMTCQTDQDDYANAYQEFITKISPIIRDYDDQLNRYYLNRVQQFPWDASRYEVYDRDLKEDLALYHAANIPLLTELQLLSQQYQALCAAWTVRFDGREQTLVAMSRYQQDPDRSVRERAWREVALRRAKDASSLEALFDQMLALRQKVGDYAGCKNFIEYQFRGYHRFDYSPQECKIYHAAVKDLVVPVWEKILARRKKQMGLDFLRPWDSEADPLGRPALKPFFQTRKLVSGVHEVFYNLRPDLGALFEMIAREGLLDLENRKGKAPGGYQDTLNESRLPFIFMNAVGLDDDVRTLLHEGGHAFHALACRHDPLLPYRHGPMEFCEVASMSMELLGGDYLDFFYGAEDKARSCLAHLEGVVHILIWVAIVDAFQHWIYEHPGHPAEERRKAWRKIFQEFGGNFFDWSGLESFQEILWHRQLHIFEVPFYYIEYGIAQLGALQLWLNVRQNKYLGLQKFMQALALGGARPLPELFETAGLKFNFSGDVIAPLVKVLSEELKLS